MGAHLAGQAARKLKKDGITIDRITGLDPAEPCFEMKFGVPQRLSRNDANFVDIIHSDGAEIINGGFGIYEAIGEQSSK